MRQPISVPLLLVVLTLAATTASASGPELGPCSVEGLPEDARCGTLEVPENRATREGRKLGLHVAVLPATEEPRRPDPLFLLEGGPGAGLSGSAAAHVQVFAGIRRHRDLVLVDQRGTGRSHALHCAARGADAPAPRGGLISPEAARACRAELEKTADPRWYTTAVAMDDLDDVRAWLGYETINLFGVSYGSRSALVYLRRHGARVRSVILMAPYPLEENVPRDAATIADAALEGTIDDCLADASCRASYPELAHDLRRLEERFATEPVQSWNGNEIDSGTFGAAVRMMLFFPGLANRVPLIVHSASRGEFGPYVFVRNYLRGSLSQWISMGTLLTILCSEDVASLDRADVERRARGTFTSADWSLGLMDACAEWPRGEVPEGFGRPVRSEVPVLLLTGRRDPSLAPEWAIDAVEELTNARTVVVEQGSHNFIGMSRVECLIGLMSDFVERGSGEQLDASCVEEMERPAFVVRPGVARPGVARPDPDKPRPETGPVISDFGPVFQVDDPDFATRTDQVHRAIFDVADAPDEGTVNRKIETVARFLNMHARAGVERRNMKLVLVLHGAAGRAALGHDAYRERFGVDNPDLPLLAALHEAGVRIVLCGQTAASRGFARDELAEPVELALSAMTVLVTLQSAGYALIAF